MTTIRIFSSHLKQSQPIEIHEFDGSFRDWMLRHVVEYKPCETQPITASSNGRLIDPHDWQNLYGVVDVRPNPQEASSVLAFVGKVILGALVSTALNMIFGKKAKKPGQTPAAQELSFADIKANQPKLNQIIPEISGRHLVYPDYLNQPRRYFVNETTQAVDLMLSVGIGEFDVESVRIGETEAGDLDGIDYAVFGPGASVTARQESDCWYSAREVGATAGGAGIRLQAGVSKTETAELTNYQITGSSILAPVGSGVLPQDWESTMTVEVVIRNRTITIADGGGTNRDLVRGDFADLALAVGQDIRIEGAGSNDGRYKINSKTSVSITGTPSSVTAVKITPLAFDASPITFAFNGESITLDEDYVDFDDLVDAINAQIGGATASHSSGVVTITDDSPFDGVTPSLTGYYDLIFGASPNYTIGIKTESYDELTLDSWQTWFDENAGTLSGWRPATALIPGVYSESSLQRVRIETVYEQQLVNGEYQSVAVEIDHPTAYRISSIVTGLLPDGETGTTGFTLVRLLPDGTDDPAWAGFSPEGFTPNVTITLQASNVVGGWVGPFVVSPGDEYVNAIEYDVFAPGGLIRYSRSGNVRTQAAGYEMQYRVNGGSWVSATHERRYATANQLGWTERVTVPDTTRRVEMRMRRTTAESTSAQTSDRLEWYGARTRLVSKPSSYPGITSLALKITGSDVISAQVDNQVNLIVTRKLAGVAERNIVPWVKYVLGSIGVDPANLDDDEFDRLHALWSARQDYFDYAQLSQNNVRDVINRALGCGYAEVSLDAGLIVPVRDEPKTQFEQSYSAQNFTEPLRRSFSAVRPDEFDGVDVTYLDPVTFVEQVVECRLPGDLGYKVETIRAEGITDRTKAWRFGMRRRREQKYRRWGYKWATEMDALNSRYMSYVAVVDDVPGYGRSGWIKDASIVGGQCVLEVSELFEAGAGGHVIAWRNADGSLSGPYPVLEIDGFEIVADTSDMPEIVQGQEPPHVYFGTTEKWCHAVMISKISPQGMASVNVEGFNYDIRVYNDDNNSP